MNMHLHKDGAKKQRGSFSGGSGAEPRSVAQNIITLTQPTGSKLVFAPTHRPNVKCIVRFTQDLVSSLLSAEYVQLLRENDLSNCHTVFIRALHVENFANVYIFFKLKILPLPLFENVSIFVSDSCLILGFRSSFKQ